MNTIELTEKIDAYLTGTMSDEECAEEWNRLADAFEKNQKQKSAPSQLPDAADYRAAIIKEVVDNMGEPCEPLLMSFYWEKKSWAIIAEELEYSGADSAKTQKSKCMGRLKALVTNRMKEVEL